MDHFESVKVGKLTQFLCDSIIAVHGIGADPDKTWETGDVNWLKDLQMLPSKVPRARIMRYGYESSWFGDDPIRQTLDNIAASLLQDLKGKRAVSYAEQKEARNF